MKKILYLMMASGLLLSACDEESKPIDPIYEFVAFKGAGSINVNEFDNHEQAYPVVIELKATSHLKSPETMRPRM